MDERLKNERRRLSDLRSRVLLAVEILNMLAAAGYVILPMDLLPDLLGILGYADDLLVAGIGIAVCLKTARARRGAPKERLADPRFTVNS